MVKLGTSIITRDEGAVIQRLASQVAKLKEREVETLVVTSGAIWAGLAILGQPGRPRDLPKLQAAAAVGQLELMRRYSDAFGSVDLKVGQLLLTRDIVANRTWYLNARNTLFELLAQRVTPVVNENDSVAVDEIRFGDNDILSALVTSLSEADCLVMLTDVEGLLGPDGLVDDVEEWSDDLLASAGAAGETGTGGMQAKLEAARIVTSTGHPVVVGPGAEEDVLPRMLAGEKLGTYFHPAPERLAHRKRWIAWAVKGGAELVIDGGAERALVRRKKSLLPKGVVEVRGEFHPGECVAVVSEDGRRVACGVARYGSGEARKIIGKDSREIAHVLGEKKGDELVHRDDIVILEE